MKVNLAKSAGFCFGVKRALQIALGLSREKKPVVMLGDIVHNREVVKQIEKSGIGKIQRLGRGKNKILLIRAHGAGADTFKNAAKAGYEIVDATCPMVKEIHKIAKEMENKGYTVIIIGDKKHDEVLGIIGQLKRKPVVIDSLRDVPVRAIKKINQACVVVQSTQNSEKVIKIILALRKYIKNLEFFNTICRPTRTKQEEIKRMPLENDVMVIIGSKKSANTGRLYEIAKSLNPRSYWVQAKRQVRPDWFRGVKNVGITAGASTPQETTQEIIAYIKGLT